MENGNGGPHRVLMVNKFCFGRGGAEHYMFRLADLLERRGAETLYFATRHPENRPCAQERYFPSDSDFENPAPGLGRVRLAGRAVYSLEARRQMASLLDDEPVDLAHLHNIYHHLSPSILEPLRRRGIPVVMTVHDYKLVCPVYLLLSDGEICERCVGGHFSNAVRHRCNRGSLPGSALVATETWLHRRLRLYQRGVNLFVAPSGFIRDKLVAGGYPAERISVVPNFVDVETIRPSFDPGASFVYVGRLVREKGVDVLIEAAAGTGLRVEIVGDGPLRADLEAQARAAGVEIVFHGYQQPPDAAAIVARSLAVVLPARWHENGPLAVIEAMAAGKPVISSRTGGLPELIVDGDTGLLAPPNDAIALRSAMLRLAESPEEAERMGRAGRARAEERYSSGPHYRAVSKAYELAAEVAACA
jgi:glycosyltransferase involved in cell wall biosynthesis